MSITGSPANWGCDRFEAACCRQELDGHYQNLSQPLRNKDANHTLDFEEVRMPRLLSVNVGLPRDVTWNGKTVRTAVWKSPVRAANGAQAQY